MKKIIYLILALILLWGCGQNNSKQFDEQQLLGTWKTISGFNFEQITFVIEDDNTHLVYLDLGQRSNLGTWIIDNGKLQIESPYDTLSYVDAIFSADTLSLIQENDNKSIFKRKIEETCDALSMLQSLKTTSKLDFSEVSDTVLTNGIKARYMTIPVRVDSTFEVLTQTISPLTEILPQLGYSVDEELVTETQAGYKLDNYRIIIDHRFKSALPGKANTEISEKDLPDAGIYNVVVICYCLQ